MDDWEYDEQDCPKCQCLITAPAFPIIVILNECDTCRGMGHETWCRECGWDMNFKCFLSPEYKRAWEEKQQQLSV